MFTTGPKRGRNSWQGKSLAVAVIDLRASPSNVCGSLFWHVVGTATNGSCLSSGSFVSDISLGVACTPSVDFLLGFDYYMLVFLLLETVLLMEAAQW